MSDSFRKQILMAGYMMHEMMADLKKQGHEIIGDAVLVKDGKTIDGVCRRLDEAQAAALSAPTSGMAGEQNTGTDKGSDLSSLQQCKAEIKKV